MAKLHVKAGLNSSPPFELQWGLNRLGRAADNHIQLLHGSISTHHCELLLDERGVTVRDCGSTNGTFVDGLRVEEAALDSGQTLRLGSVELVLEHHAAPVVVPPIETPQLPKSYHLPGGELSCINHPQIHASFHCQQCHRLFCEECVHVLHRAGGRKHLLCPRCSGNCDLITFADESKQRSWLERLRTTILRPFEKRER